MTNIKKVRKAVIPAAGSPQNFSDIQQSAYSADASFEKLAGRAVKIAGGII